MAKARAEAGVAPKQGWTRQEDETILRTVQTTGMKWSAIAAVLPGRTDDAVRNRYLRLQRKKGGLAIGAHVDGGMTVQITDQAKRGDMWTAEEDTQIMAAVATLTAAVLSRPCSCAADARSAGACTLAKPC